MRTCTHKARSRPNGYFLKIDNKKFYQIKVIVWSLGKNSFRKYWYIFIEKQNLIKSLNYVSAWEGRGRRVSITEGGLVDIYRYGTGGHLGSCGSSSSLCSSPCSRNCISHGRTYVRNLPLRILEVSGGSWKVWCWESSRLKVCSWKTRKLGLVSFQTGLQFLRQRQGHLCHLRHRRCC